MLKNKNLPLFVCLSGFVCLEFPSHLSHILPSFPILVKNILWLPFRSPSSSICRYTISHSGTLGMPRLTVAYFGEHFIWFWSSLAPWRQVRTSSCGFIKYLISINGNVLCHPHGVYYKDAFLDLPVRPATPSACAWMMMESAELVINKYLYKHRKYRNRYKYRKAPNNVCHSCIIMNNKLTLRKTGSFATSVKDKDVPTGSSKNGKNVRGLEGFWWFFRGCNDTK